VDSLDQEHTARQAGAHYVLLKGHLGDALKNAIDQILPV
jgi:hypothetical protein